MILPDPACTAICLPRRCFDLDAAGRARLFQLLQSGIECRGTAGRAGSWCTAACLLLGISPILLLTARRWTRAHVRDRRGDRRPAGGAAAAGRAAAAGVSRLRQRRHRDPGRRPDRAAPGAGQARPSGRAARGRAAGRRAPASATPAGPPTARPTRPTPTRTSARASRWSTTASSRTSRSCAPSSWRSGHGFATQTDTEVVPHLISAQLARGMAPREAAAGRGAPAEGRLRAGDAVRGPRRPAGRRPQGRPLAIGYGEDEMFVGSDALALAPLTERIQYLEEGDIAFLGRKGAVVLDAEGRAGRAADPADRAERGADRQGQPPPLHGEGDLRAAGGARRHAALLRRPGDAPDRAARAAVRPRRGAAARGRRLRHRLLRLPGRQVLVREPGRPAGRLGHRVASSATARRRWCRARSGCSSPSRARPPTRWRRCATCEAAGHQALAVVNVPGEHAGPRGRRPAAHAGRPRDRRRLDQGVHHPARHPGLPRGRRRPRPRPADARARGRS